MLSNINNAGSSAINALNAFSSRNRIGEGAPVSASGRVSSLGGVRQSGQYPGMKSAGISSKPAAYIMSEAPKQFVRSARSRETGAYRAGLESSGTKDDVNALNILAYDSALRDLKRSGDEESGFVMRHMDKLMRQRDKFMSEEKYQRLSWSSDVAEGQSDLRIRANDDTVSIHTAVDGAADTAEGTAEPAPEESMELGGGSNVATGAADHSREAQQFAQDTQFAAQQPVVMNNVLAASQIK